MELTRRFVDDCKEKAGKEYDDIAFEYHATKKIGKPSLMEEQFKNAHNNWMRAYMQWVEYNKQYEPLNNEE